MKFRFICGLAAIAFIVAFKATASIPAAVELFPLSDVRITAGPLMHAQRMDICYLLALDPDRLLAPYLKEVGLTPTAENYPNWENTGLDGHIGGHYLSALSYMYASTGNQEIKHRLDYMIDGLKRCADASGDGYVCGVPGGRLMWDEIARGEIRADGFSLNGKWVPLYNIHKTYAGLRDAWMQTGNATAREMLINLTDWMLDITTDLSDDQIQEMLRSEHGGLNEVFADVADITGDTRYLDLAMRFSHRQLLDPLLKGLDTLTGMHANTQIPKVVGFKRIADLTGDAALSNASLFFWNTVTRNRSITIGGNSVREHFHPSDNFSSMIESEQGPETCNTYNMMRLTRMLYATSADPTMIDYYEQALYNHILSSINPVQGGFVYFTPMRSGHYRVYSQPHTSFWCCVGSGLENHARYGEMIYGHDDSTLYVNLFIPSTVRWGETTITQTTEFPYCDSTELTVTGTGTPRRFTLKLRVPEWSDGDKVQLSINGSPQHSPAIDNGYIAITREWSDGDKVSMTIPMTLRATGLPDGSEYYSFMYGPIVLASCLGQERQDGIFADDSRGGHIASGPKTPLHEIPAIIGSRDSLLHHLVRDYSQPLAFTLHGVSDNRYEGMKLQPFFEIHQCRYMVYWQVCTSAPRLTSGHGIESGERYREALDAMTVDMVRCGEQQPESDHFITYENSTTGNDNGIPWREAEGRFSYKLTNRDGKASSLRIAYTPDPTRSARITIGDCQPVPLSGADGICLIELPINQHRAQQVDVTIESDSGNTTPRISEIRLVTVSEE